MTEPPNLLFIMSDNHNRNLLGCYGHPVVQTPNMDRIAAAGVRFVNAYGASPLCCPARAALATGRYPHQTGYWDNAIVYDGRVKSWMHRLREAGYETVSVGKLHFRSSEDDNGFSEELIPMHILDGRGGVLNLLRGYDAEASGADAKRWEMYLEKSGVGETHYQQYDRDVTAHATRWLKARREKKGPWALFVSYASPHPPFIVPQRLLDKYPADQIPLPSHFFPDEVLAHPSLTYHRDKFGNPVRREARQLQRMIAAYYGLVSHVDEQVGQVLNCLAEEGLEASTRVVYTSDHGEMRGAHGILGKAILYEEAAAAPLLISGPGVPRGKVVRQLVSHVDLYPTLLESCAVPLGAEDADLRGRSLWPALMGHEAAVPIFAEYHANFSRSGGFMLREGDLKLIYHVGMPPQLFDLGRDPSELHDLAASEEGRVEVRRLEQLLRSICNPEEVDQRAKAAQREQAEKYGGIEQIRKARSIAFTPPPGLNGDEIGAFGDKSSA